ncbi:MAG TPA: hypothetical protein VGN35_00290 [Jatrophihabitantaceae bacterium]|jgi:hypothetical protein|nr:hypothetical protein [Jatrophihabitantaceae bacterium]
MSKRWSAIGVILALTSVGVLALPGAASADTPSSDLRLSFGFLPGPTPAVGGTTFTFDLSAVGGTAEESASMTLTLPPEFQFVSASIDSPNPLTTCSTVGNSTTCALGTITATPQSGPVVYFNVKFGPNVLPNTRYRATATVTGALPDPDPSNNNSYETVRILPTSDLVASVSPTALIRGRTNWVTITVKNAGPDPAAAIQFTYLYLRGAGFDWGPGADLDWHATGLLAPGRSLSKSFPITASASARTGEIAIAPVAASNANPQCTAGQCAVLFTLTARDAPPTLAETGRPTKALLIWGIAIIALGLLTTVVGRRSWE